MTYGLLKSFTFELEVANFQRCIQYSVLTRRMCPRRASCVAIRMSSWRLKASVCMISRVYLGNSNYARFSSDALVKKELSSNATKWKSQMSK